MMNEQSVIGKTAHVLSGRLMGRMGTVIEADGEYATLQTGSSRITVPLEDLEIETHLYDTDKQPASRKSLCSLDDWYDPYAEKT